MRFINTNRTCDRDILRFGDTIDDISIGIGSERYGIFPGFEVAVFWRALGGGRAVAEIPCIVEGIIDRERSIRKFHRIGGFNGAAFER